MLEARDETAIRRCMGSYEEERRRAERRNTRVERGHDQFGRKMNESISSSRKLFWKYVFKGKNRKLENAIRKRQNRKTDKGKIMCERIGRSILRMLMQKRTLLIIIYIYGLF